MGRVVLELSADEVQRVLAIDLDESSQEALEFVQKVLAKRLRERLTPK